MRTAKTLIRLGGCPGWSESSLGAQSLCWFCHVAAHFAIIKLSTISRLSKQHVNITHFHLHVQKENAHCLSKYIFFKSEKVWVSVHSWQIMGLGPEEEPRLHYFPGMDRYSDFLLYVITFYFPRVFCGGNMTGFGCYCLLDRAVWSAPFLFAA